MDRRIEKTKSKIKKALSRLVLAKGFENVRVGEVAKAAGVNRSTLYIHYPNIDSILYELEDDLIAQITLNVGVGNPGDTFEDYMERLAMALLSHRETIQVVLSSSYAHFQNKVEHVLLPLLQGIFEKQHYDPDVERMLITFLLDGSIGVIGAFFRAKKDPSEEDVRVLVKEFVRFFSEPPESKMPRA